jgi:hypothetical protein
MARANNNDTTNLSGLARQQAERVQAVTSLKKLRRKARAEINRLIDLAERPLRSSTNSLGLNIGGWAAGPEGGSTGGPCQPLEIALPKKQWR